MNKHRLFHACTLLPLQWIPDCIFRASVCQFDHCVVKNRLGTRLQKSWRASPAHAGSVPAAFAVAIDLIVT